MYLEYVRVFFGYKSYQYQQTNFITFYTLKYLSGYLTASSLDFCDTNMYIAARYSVTLGNRNLKHRQMALTSGNSYSSFWASF